MHRNLTGSHGRKASCEGGVLQSLLALSKLCVLTWSTPKLEIAAMTIAPTKDGAAFPTVRVRRAFTRDGSLDAFLKLLLAEVPLKETTAEMRAQCAKREALTRESRREYVCDLDGSLLTTAAAEELLTGLAQKIRVLASVKTPGVPAIIWRKPLAYTATESCSVDDFVHLAVKWLRGQFEESLIHRSGLLRNVWTALAFGARSLAPSHPLINADVESLLEKLDAAEHIDGLQQVSTRAYGSLCVSVENTDTVGKYDYRRKRKDAPELSPAASPTMAGNETAPSKSAAIAGPTPSSLDVEPMPPALVPLSSLRDSSTNIASSLRRPEITPEVATRREVKKISAWSPESSRVKPHGPETRAEMHRAWWAGVDSRSHRSVDPWLLRGASCMGLEQEIPLDLSMPKRRSSTSEEGGRYK